MPPRLPTDPALGQAIRQMREQRGQTQEELASAAGSHVRDREPSGVGQERTRLGNGEGSPGRPRPLARRPRESDRHRGAPTLAAASPLGSTYPSKAEPAGHRLALPAIGRLRHSLTSVPRKPKQTICTGVRAVCERCVIRWPSWAAQGHHLCDDCIEHPCDGRWRLRAESKTVAPERGDYYLTPDGEMTQAPGRWLADPETLARLGVRAGEPVESADFIALMDGRHPGTGRWLRPEGAGGGRGGGIDVTFSAPKSVSTVWALGDPWQRGEVEAAHARAVESTVRYLREQVPLVRRRYDGQVVEEHAKDVIAAEYRHTTARGVSGAQAPDPQLHSHVVISGAVREDKRIVAVASRPIFRSARELGAFYRSALAEELAGEGYEIERGTGKDGRYFEIAGVPRTLIEEFSGRSREVARAAERFRARYGRAPERGELRNLALDNRRAKELTTRADLQRVWGETGLATTSAPTRPWA